MINIAQETLDLRCVRISRTLWLLMPTFLLPYTPRWVTPYASAHMEHSPTDRSRLAALDLNELISRIKDRFLLITDLIYP